MESSRAVAVAVSDALGGGAAGRVAVACGVALSTLGSCNGSILTGGRLFFAVARGEEGEGVGAAVAAAGWDAEGGVVSPLSGGDDCEEDIEDPGEAATLAIGRDNGIGGGNGNDDGADNDSGRPPVRPAPPTQPTLLPRWCGVLNGNGAPARALVAQVIGKKQLKPCQPKGPRLLITLA